MQNSVESIHNVTQKLLPEIYGLVAHQKIHVPESMRIVVEYPGYCCTRRQGRWWQ